MKMCHVSDILRVRLLARREQYVQRTCVDQRRIEIDNPSTALQEITRHFQLHRIDILYKCPYAGPIGTRDCPLK